MSVSEQKACFSYRAKSTFLKYFRLFSLSRKQSTPFSQIAQAKAEKLNNPFIPAYCRLIQRRGALPRPVSASRATRSDKRFRAPHAPDPKIPGGQRHALLCRTGATRPRFGQLAQPRQVRSGLATTWQAHFFCAPSGPPQLPWTGRQARPRAAAPWGKGDARRNQQAAFQRSGFRRRAVRSRRRPACAGCQGTLLLLPGRAGLACRFRAVTQPRLRAACEPASQGARGQARWGHRRSAAREWLAEAALPAMASARSAERAKAAPTAHRAVGTAFQNLASAGSQAPCLRPPSGRQSSCTRRKCCRSGAYAPGCSGPWRAQEPCAWPRGKSAW